MHVVIIGFANYDTNEKYLFEYENIKGEPHRINVKNVTPYLTEGRDLFILKEKRQTYICCTIYEVGK